LTIGGINRKGQSHVCVEHDGLTRAGPLVLTRHGRQRVGPSLTVESLSDIVQTLMLKKGLVTLVARLT
jgi:hypothetical protein